MEQGAWTKGKEITRKGRDWNSETEVRDQRSASNEHGAKSKALRFEHNVRDKFSDVDV
jgi:hypothetical protein